jgi:hypothetical protein
MVQKLLIRDGWLLKVRASDKRQRLQLLGIHENGWHRLSAYVARA